MNLHSNNTHLSTFDISRSISRTKQRSFSFSLLSSSCDGCLLAPSWHERPFLWHCRHLSMSVSVRSSPGGDLGFHAFVWQQHSHDIVTRCCRRPNRRRSRHPLGELRRTATPWSDLTARFSLIARLSFDISFLSLFFGKCGQGRFSSL